MNVFNNSYPYPSNNQYTTFQHFLQSSEKNSNPLGFLQNQRQQDQSFLTEWYIKLKQRGHKFRTKESKEITISSATEQLKNLLDMINNLKEFEVSLRENFNMLTELEWSESIAFVKNERENIDKILTDYTNYVSDLKKLILKRNSKRSRISRKNAANKTSYANMLTKRAKKSKAIDERLQKIKDDIEKVKEEEDINRISNITLKEILSKKADAKKNIALLESLVALRKARINTARGRGENVSQSDTSLFAEKIEKLIFIWKKAFETYSAEIKILRGTLDEAYKSKLVGKRQASKQNVDGILNEWRESIFGHVDAMPQRDFQYNLDHFIAVRSQWDLFLNIDGSPLPAGWLLSAPFAADNENNGPK